ncbi:hypothetical protein L6452_22555 [Arctium lappa]|uniref:Uncharacterized protein n=1 Tax=Arctium lappa TaxID=4217 RepID=A0ACB9B115_ARCLA|nr:hypothetical protein L6452_22555 [Arctium lappa]
MVVVSGADATTGTGVTGSSEAADAKITTRTGDLRIIGDGGGARMTGSGIADVDAVEMALETNCLSSIDKKLLILGVRYPPNAPQITQKLDAREERKRGESFENKSRNEREKQWEMGCRLMGFRLLGSPCGVGAA